MTDPDPNAGPGLTWTVPTRRRRRRLHADAWLAPVITLAVIVFLVLPDDAGWLPIGILVAANAAFIAYGVRRARREAKSVQFDGQTITLRGPAVDATIPVEDLTGIGRTWTGGAGTYLQTGQRRYYLSPYLPQAHRLRGQLRVRRPDLQVAGPR